MEFLKEWFWWFILKLAELPKIFAESLFDAMLEALPSNNAGNFYDAFGDFWGVANDWLPLTEAIGLYAALLTFRASLIVLLWVLKFIPTIG